MGQLLYLLRIWILSFRFQDILIPFVNQQLFFLQVTTFFVYVFCDRERAVLFMKDFTTLTAPFETDVD
jgi:hypothetical protein